MSSLMNNYGRFKISFAYGLGAKLYTADNEEYLDFASGISVTNLGHNFKPLTDAVCSQAAKVMHTSNLYEIPLQEDLPDLGNEPSGPGTKAESGTGVKTISDSRLPIDALYHKDNKRARV